MKDVLKHSASMFATLGTGLVIAALFQQDGVNMIGVYAGIWVMVISVLTSWLSTQYD